MSIRMGVVMDAIEHISVKKDTTLALMLAAQSRGVELSYMQQHDLFIDQGVAKAQAAQLSVNDGSNGQPHFTLDEQRIISLGDLDIVLMRKDPPFDNAYIYSTYILELAEKAGALVANKPSSLRDFNEKVFATHFPQFMSPTLVSSQASLLKAFHNEHQDVIFKPLDGMGGASIFRAKPDDANLSVIIETLTEHGKLPIMAQKFIPQISSGDKRILIIHGEVMPYCLARIPAEGETRGNLAAGGRGVVQPLSDKDRAIAEHIAPTLKAKGLLLVGLDVIGECVTEINVTSPTCVREISAGSGIDIAGQFIDGLLALRA